MSKCLRDFSGTSAGNRPPLARMRGDSQNNSDRRRRGIRHLEKGMRSESRQKSLGPLFFKPTIAQRTRGKNRLQAEPRHENRVLWKLQWAQNIRIQSLALLNERMHE